METTNAEQIQILYEIAFGFDNHASLKNNLKKTLSTILRRMNCTAGSILIKSTLDINCSELEHFLSIPKFVSSSNHFVQMVQKLNKRLEVDGWDAIISELPIFHRLEENNYYYILGLSDFGLLILEKKETETTWKFLKSLEPVLNKIGESCLHVIHQEDLEKNRQRLSSIYLNVPICLYKSSFGGTILMINPAGREMFGCEFDDEIVNKNIIDFYFDKNDRNVFLNFIRDESVINNFEVFFKKKNGEKFLGNLNASAFRDDENNIIYFEGSIEDITQRKEAEKQLLLAKEVAERSERLQSEFLAQISHEIRTPINSILNFLYVLEEEYKNVKTENSEFGFNVIKSSTYRLLRTIDLVLNISEVEAGVYNMQNEKLNLNKDIIFPLITEFNPIAKAKGLELEYINNSVNGTALNVDKYTITQILVNLINNAIKYTDNGFVKLIVDKIQNRLVIKIIDSGIGISENYIPYLFERFSQEEGGYSRKFEGNGLGLALVKKYCELNNAEITCESIKGAGTTFSVIFKNIF